MKNEDQNETTISSADGAEKKHEEQSVELSLRAILETAKAVQHIRTLEKLKEPALNTGKGRVTARRAVLDLAELCCEPRRIIALMLYAADHPDWAWVNYWAAFCPGISLRQMALLRKISISTVKTHLRRGREKLRGVLSRDFEQEGDAENANCQNL